MITIKSIWQGKLVRLRGVEIEDWEPLYNWSLDTEGTYHDEITFGMTREEFEANENFNRG